jgi:hypothetical protein
MLTIALPKAPIPPGLHFGNSPCASEVVLQLAAGASQPSGGPVLLDVPASQR